MATIKSYTDVSQSKKLAEILPLESADMYYTPSLIKGHTGYFPHLKRKFPIDWDIEQAIPCWSLAALLGVLPKKIQVADSFYVPSIHFTYIDYWNTNNGNTLFAFQSEDSLVDVCVEMIEKLHELNLL